MQISIKAVVGISSVAQESATKHGCRQYQQTVDKGFYCHSPRAQDHFFKRVFILAQAVAYLQITHKKATRLATSGVAF
jgi:hypothetical protein